MLSVSSHLTFWPKEGSIAWLVAVWFPIMLWGCKTEEKTWSFQAYFSSIKTLQVNEWAFAGVNLQFNLQLVDHPKCLNATDGGYLGVHSLITLTAVSRTQSMLMEKDTQSVLCVFVCLECVCMEDGTYFNGSCSQSPLVRPMAGKGCHGNRQTAAVWPLQLRGTG